MSVAVESNTTEILARLGQRYRGLPDAFEAAVVNAVKYAAAVDQGYTREVVWAELSKAQRYAIIKAIEKRYGPAPKEGESPAERKYKREGTALTRSENPKSFKLVIPPAGMLAKSVKPTKAFGRQLLRRLPQGFGEKQARLAVAEIAFFAQSMLVDHTPVDQAVLVKGWEVKL